MSSQVTLSWTAATPQPGTSIAQYIIYKQFQGNWPPIGTSTTPSFTDAAVNPSTTYTYYVVAVDSKGAVSGPSNQVSITTTINPPAQVTGLTASAVSTSEIDLTWSAVAGASSYTVYSDGVLDTSGVTTTSFKDVGLAATSTHTYQVSASNSAGEGAKSATASATTQAGTAGTLLLNETWATPTSIGTFPASTTYSSRWSGVGDTGQTRNIQSSPVSFNGGNVGYFVVNPAGCTGTGSTCQPTGAIHSMVVYAGPQANFVAGKPYVLGFALFMSGGWAPNGSANGISGGFDIIFQFHPSDQLKDGTTVTSGPYANPMMTIQPINGVGQPFQLNIIGRTSTSFTGSCIANPVAACFSAGSLNRNVTYNIGIVTLNTWIGFGFEFQISTLPDGSDGYMRGYFSPGLGQPFTQEFNDIGANDYYSDSRTPYATLGEYHGEGSRSIPPGPQAARQIAYGPVRFGRVDAPSNCTLADVIPWLGNH